MSAKSEQAKAKRREYQREYQKQWQKKFKETHGMSYRQALALKKAVQMLNTVTERNTAK